MYNVILPVKIFRMFWKFLLILPLFTSDICLADSSTDKYSKSSSGQPYQGVFIDENTRVGVASWYGDKEHGNKAASGEVFSRYDYTAAHQTLPLGTMVRVTNLSNGRDVIVKINARGPLVKNRIIDLSYEAAKSIGLVEKGTATVKVEVLSSPSSRKQSVFNPVYTVQIASFSSRVNAISLRNKLGKMVREDVRVDTVKIKNGTFYRVRVGMFKDRRGAERMRKSLKSYGYKGRIILE